MKFNFDQKEYDSDKLSEQGKAILDKLQQLIVKKNQLANDYADIQILEKHYTALLKKELPKELLSTAEEKSGTVQEQRKK